MVGLAYVFPLVVGTVFLLGFRRPSDRVLAVFSDVYAVPVTAINRQLLEHYIRWSRTGRLTGLLAGLAVSVVMPDGSRMLWVIAGYGLGAVVAELTRPHVPGSAATLRPRRMTDYVGRELIALLVVSATVVAVGLICGGLGGGRGDVRSDSLGVAAAAAGYLVLAIVAAGRIVRAPQPVTDRHLDAAEHAVRSSALIALVGLSLLAVGQLGTVAWQMTMNGSLRSIGLVVVWVSGLLALGGAVLTFRSLPRFAPFWRKLPEIEPAASAS